MQSKRSFVRSIGKIGLYALSAGIPAISNFLLIPLLLRRLGVEQFSIFALLEPTILIIANLLLGGAQFAILREVSQNERSAADAFAVLLSVVSISFLVVGTLAGATIWSMYGAFIALIFCLVVFLEALSGGLTYIFRAQSRIALLAINDGGRAMLLLLVIWSSASLHLVAMTSIEDVLSARAVIATIVVGTLAFTFAGRGRSNFRAIIEAVRYGFPFLLSGLMNVASINLDRYIIGFTGGTSMDITNYVVHSKAGGIMAILFLAPVQLWYPTQVMKARGNLPRDEMQCIMATFSTAFILVLLTFLLVAPWIWQAAFPGTKLDEFLFAGSMLAIGMQTMGIFWNTGSLQLGYTRWNVLPPSIFLISMASLGFIGGQIWGVRGIAVAKILSLSIYACSFYAISSKVVGRPTPIAPNLLFGFAAASCLAFSLVDVSFRTERASIAVCLALLLTSGLLLNRAAILRTFSSSK